MSTFERGYLFTNKEASVQMLVRITANFRTGGKQCVKRWEIWSSSLDKEF